MEENNVSSRAVLRWLIEKGIKSEQKTTDELTQLTTYQMYQMYIKNITHKYLH